MSARWKIAHVLPALTKGGAERVVVNLANHAARAGHAVSMVVGFRVDDALLRTAIDPCVDVKYVSRTLPFVRAGIQQYAWIGPWVWKHRTWLRKQDIVHSHLSFGSLTGTLVRGVRIATRSAGPKVVETYHAVGMAIPPSRRAMHAILASTHDGIALMAEDAYWRDFAAQHPQLVSSVIPNGITLRASTIAQASKIAYRRQAGIPDDCLVVGTVGMLRADREPWRYLPIFRAVAREMGNGVHFVIAGGGVELERMRALVTRERLQDRVHLPGIALDPAIPRSIMDVYVTLNVGNATGLAAMEAASDGLPIVAIQQLVDHQDDGTDWIWSSPEPGNVASRIIDLLRSPSARELLGKKQQMHVREHHTIEAMARAYYALYERILSAAPPT